MDEDGHARVVSRHGYVILPPLETNRETSMSINAHLTSLENKHRAIEAQIAEELSHPNADSVKLQALKRKKLQIKDSINRIRQPRDEQSVH